VLFSLLLALGFFLLYTIIGIEGAAIIFSIFLVGWSMYSKRLLSIGLMKADMHAYFDARSRGLNHHEAISKVIRYRYPFSQNKRSVIKSMFDKIASKRGNEINNLKALIYVMHCHEANKPPTLNCKDKIFLKIDHIYDSIRSRYVKDQKEIIKNTREESK
jgi:hypothetical protein